MNAEIEITEHSWVCSTMLSWFLTKPPRPTLS